MLVLTRVRGSKIVFPSLDVVVEVLSVQGKKVRLGITAPKHVAVHRQEIAQRIAKEHRHERPN